MKESIDNFKTKVTGKINSNLGIEEEPKRDLGYVEGYDTLTYFDRLMEKTKISNIVKKKGEKEPLPVKTYTTTADENFIQSVNRENDVDFTFEDPTFLGFKLCILEDSSPLFNYADTVNYNYNASSALGFIKKYSAIPEIEQRESIYIEFIEQIKKIIPNNTSDKKDSGKKQYYITQITGLDKLTDKITEYEKNVIKVTFTEDVSMRMMYITELYNNLVYSYKNAKYLIPDNCLRFNMEIIISDIRKFKLPDGKTATGSINYDEPSMRFKLSDCLFDFSNSKIYKDGLINAGFGALDMSPCEMEVTIKYGSVERIFSSPLIYHPDGQVMLSTKAADTISIGKDSLTYLEGIIAKSKEKPKDIPAQADTRKGNKFKSAISEAANAAGSAIIDTATSAAEQAIDQGFQELRKARGNMINKLMDEIRGGINVPRMNPANVYDEDFNKFTLDNFVTGLVTDVVNDADNTIRGGLNSAGGF